MTTRTISTKLVIEGEEQYRQILQNCNNDLKTMQSELAELQNEYQGQANGMAALEAKGNMLNSMYERQQEHVQAAKGALDAARNASGAAVDVLSEALAASGAVGALDQLKESLIVCVDSAKQFEEGMAEAFTLLPGQSEEVYQKLSADMLQFSGDMNVLTTDGMPALYQALSAGVEKENVFTFMETAQKAAVGGVTNLETTVDSLTSIVNAYGESNINAAQTADMMFTAVKLGKTDFEQLSESIYNVVPTAAEAKIEFDSVAAALAVITAQGVPTSAATTQLRQMLMELADSGSEVGKTFENVTGQSFKEFVVGGGNIQQALQKLEEHAAQTGVGINQLFSSVESGNAAVQLTGSATESFTKALEEMKNSAGATDQAYGTMTETAEYAAQRVQVSFENVKIAIGTALLPAFRNLADIAADGLSWAAEFIGQNPWIVEAVGAVAIALSTMTVAVTGFTKVTEVASLMQDAFSKVLGASPVGLATIAIGTAVTALIAFCAIAGNAETEAQKLTNSLRESKEAYEETAAAVEENSNHLMETVGALETLAGKESKTVAEKETLLALVRELNEAVPELGLSYNEETDSLNLTTEAIRGLALAEAERAEQEAALERLKELYVEQAKIQEQLTYAEEALTAAEAEGADEAERYREAKGPSMMQARDMHGLLNMEQQAVSQLTNEQRLNLEEIERLQKEYNSYEKTLEDTNKKGRELEVTTKSLIAGEDSLTKAFQEQKKSGELSLDTILSLIDAGQANMLTVDAETGAVKLNTSAYAAAYTEKINDQIASLQTQQTSIDTALALEGEAIMTTELASGYLSATAAREAMQGQKISITAQVNQLEELKKRINSYSGAASEAATTTKRASAAVKTQAEKDLESFKNLKAELDHEKAMGEKTEEEYYRTLQGYRDKYLTSQDNIDTFRSITESLYDYEQGLLDEQLKSYENHLQSMADEAAGVLDEIKKNYDDALAQQDEMRTKLSQYGDLFEVKDGKIDVNDIQEQMDVMDRYWETLSNLRTRGISDGLMDEVLGMSVDDAIAYGSELWKLEDPQWEDYNALWEEKQQRAKEIADEFFKTELETLQTEYNDKLGEALDTLKGTSIKSGENAGQGLIEGLKNKEDDIYKKAKQIADNIAATLAAAYSGIDDEDNKKKKSGSHAAGLSYVPFDGYVAELHKGEMVLTASEAKSYITAAMPSSMEVPSSPNTSAAQTAAIINAIGTMTAGIDTGRKGGDLTVVVPVNGTDLARATIRDFRQVSDQSPRQGGEFV